MIEFLPPRADAFGDDPAEFSGVDTRADDAFDDGPPRSPWLTALAALALGGLLAGGVVAAAPWEGPDASAPTTTTPGGTVPSATPGTASDATRPQSGGSTGTGPGGAGGDPLLPDSLEQPNGWLPTGDGTGFTVTAATSSTGSGTAGDGFAFWITEGATRTEGRWLAIDEIPSGYAELRRDARVIDVPRGDATWPAVVSESADGVIELTVAPADPLLPWFALTGHGWSVDELAGLAATVEVAPGVVSPGAEPLAAGGLLDGLVEAYRGTTDWDPGAAITGSGRAFTWLGNARTGTTAAVVVSAVATPALFISQFLVRVPVDAASLPEADRDRLADLAALGRDVSLFRVARDARAVGAAWYDGDGNEVMVVSNGRIDELVDLVTSIEPASTTEWADATARERTPTGGDDRPVEIGGSVDEGWSVLVSTRSMWISDIDGWSATGWPLTEGRSAIRFANVTAAHLVLVDATRGGADGRIADAALVTQGGDEQRVPLVALDDGTRAAAVRVDPRAPFRITWLGSDGAVLPGGS
jgi:hypothetical protein